MLTILEAIRLSTEYLEKKGIESPRLNVELMLADILFCKRLDLYLRFERPLKENEVNKLREWITRRSKYEPLQYILGKTEFYGLTFNLNNSVLIPRQETEALVELIIIQNKSKNNLNILDIGTGSGIIPVVLAKYMPDAKYTAIDSSNEAISVANHNAEEHNVLNIINFNATDLFKADYANESFDIIVSNPPYVPLAEYNTLQREIIEYEPKQAITDSEDGFKYYKYISEKAKSWLKHEGRIYFEVGKDQHSRVENILLDNSFTNITTSKDLLNIERVVVGIKK